MKQDSIICLKYKRNPYLDLMPSVEPQRDQNHHFIGSTFTVSVISKHMFSFKRNTAGICNSPKNNDQDIFGIIKKEFWIQEQYFNNSSGSKLPNIFHLEKNNYLFKDLNFVYHDMVFNVTVFLMFSQNIGTGFDRKYKTLKFIFV